MAETPRKPPRQFSLLQILPNLVTVGAICAGLTAIRFAFQGNFEMSAALIVLAAALDGMDGRLARLLKSESEIGAELDSLADFVNFGVTPGLVMYLWALQEARSAGWIAVLIFAICCVLRLARFNVGNRSEAAKLDPASFVGVPAPAGAMLVMLPLYLAFLLPALHPMPELVIAAYMVLIGLLMISRMPTPSLKAAKFYAEQIKFVVIGFVALVAALLTYPWATLVALDIAYIVALIWAWRTREPTEEPQE